MKLKDPQHIMHNGRASLMRFFDSFMFVIPDTKKNLKIVVMEDIPFVKLLIVKVGEKQRFKFFEN